MTSNEWNARSLDTQRFTELAGGIRLQTPLTDLPRVLEVSSDTAAVSTVPLCDWSLDGQIRGEGARLQHWMHLQAALSLPQTCQRCLEAMPVSVQVDRRFRFVADEATALAEGAERAPAYPLMSALVRMGCRTAIAVSKHI